MELRSIGAREGELLGDNQFLEELGKLLQRYNVDVVYSHSPFYGYRSGGMELLLPEHVSDAGVQEIMEHINTHEIQRPCSVHVVKSGQDKSVIYEGGKFYGNGIKLLVEDYKVLDTHKYIEDAYELAYKALNDEKFWEEPRCVVWVYRNSVAYLSYHADMQYSCPEYIKHIYPVFEELEALCRMYVYGNPTNDVFEREMESAIQNSMYEQIKSILGA